MIYAGVELDNFINLMFVLIHVRLPTLLQLCVHFYSVDYPTSILIKQNTIIN